MMTKQEFEACLEKHADEIERIRQSAHELHRSVNQTYGDGLPYSYHLDMVVSNVREFGHLVCASEEDVLPLIFGGYYHDSIEDARLTCNDVNKIAHRWMGDRQSYMAAEIVYALTNDKGRTRAERAGEKYYQGIRETPYAPFVKLADRLANITYSCSNSNDSNEHMRTIYRMELPHFLESLSKVTNDPRLLLPDVMVDAMLDLVIEKPGNSRVMKK
jgi:(p)ppGpp synthase/HD superfamily hydrolase